MYKSSFLSNPSFRAFILAVNIFYTNNSNAQQVKENNYTSTMELSTKNSKNRNIIELDYMKPIWDYENRLIILDTKLKADNHQSKEINLGLVHRNNFNDNVIIGVYGYFDYRRTGTGFNVSGITLGAEALSQYLDARVNLYLPFKDKKKICHNNKKTVEIKGTSIFAITGGHKYEYAHKGYDIEVGGPIFGFSENINEKIGTKLFVARYDFRAKGVKSIIGTRFRLEQKLGSMQLREHRLNFTLNAETQYDKVRKRQSYIGLGAKLELNNNNKKPLKGLNNRMMDTVIRDVDIVTESHQELPKISPFAMNGKEINKIYYVGAARDNYEGEGTQDNPLSIEQLNKTDINDAIIILVDIDRAKGGKRISTEDYNRLTELPQVVNGKSEMILHSKSEDQVIIFLKSSDQGISLVIPDAQNTILKTQTRQPVGSNTENEVILADADKVLVQSQTTGIVHTISNQIEETNLQIALVNSIETRNQLESVRAEVIQEIVANNGIINEEQERGMNQRLQEAETRDTQARAEVLERARPVIERLEQEVQEQPRDIEQEVQEQPRDIELSNLIDDIINLTVMHSNNPYVVRNEEYEAVNAIILANPTWRNIQLESYIDSNIDISKRDRYKQLVRKILEYNGEVTDAVVAYAQQGIGYSHKSSIDVTGAFSLQRLQQLYGVLDGDLALDLMKQIAISRIKANVQGVDQEMNPVELNLGINIGDVIPGQNYINASQQYLAGTNLEQNRQIIDQEVKHGFSNVNKYLAAYRALKRLEDNAHGIFTEEILGRYNASEALAYAVRAVSDVDEIGHSLTNRGIALTPENINKQQKENIDVLITALGASQRAYNMDPDTGSIDTRYGNDAISCNHGYFVRLVDAIFQTGHRQVKLSHTSSASFADEFRNTIIQKVRALPAHQKTIVEEYQNDHGDNIKIDFNGQNIIYSSVDPRVPFIALPNDYSRIISETKEDLHNRYNFLSPNPKERLVKAVDSKATFNNLRYIGF